MESQAWVQGCGMSADIGELAAALAKAQGEMKPAKKDAENPYFKSSYADLSSVWESCREALAKNGLAVIQTTATEDEGVVIFTTLAHSSGQWMRGQLKLKPVKSDPQGFGSAITYGRRYGLAAMVGVASAGDDDDATAASEPKAMMPKAKKDTIDAKQVAQIYALAKKHNVPPEEARTYLKLKGYAQVAEVKPEDYEAICKWLSSTKPADLPLDIPANDDGEAVFPDDGGDNVDVR